MQCNAHKNSHFLKKYKTSRIVQIILVKKKLGSVVFLDFYFYYEVIVVKCARYWNKDSQIRMESAKINLQMGS